jgi:SAM-dependent methyltransferase
VTEPRRARHQRRFYDEHARDYDRWMRFYDPLMLGDARRRVCSLASGRTLELAIGTGLNLSFYPGDVRLTGVDLSPAMLAVAGQRARELGVDVELRLGDAHALDLPVDSFDTVVSTLFFSSVPSPRQAAAEVLRVLKPGGRLLLLDHVRSPILAVRLVERLLGPPLRRFSGCDLMRDPLDYLGAGGFVVESCRRSRLGVVLEVVARKGSACVQSRPRYAVGRGASRRPRACYLGLGSLLLIAPTFWGARITS